MRQQGKFILMNREELKVYIENLKEFKSFTSVQQHHTSSPSYKDCKNNNEFSLMQSMENHHIKNKGMSEIAQHFSTFPTGLICIARPLTKDGGGFMYPLNKNSITIENVGDFRVDIMTEEQKKSIILLNALLCKKFNITPSTDTLIYHCWTKSTECPSKGYFGGDTKESANKNFIPLVKNAIEELDNKKEDDDMFCTFKEKSDNVGIIQQMLNDLKYTNKNGNALDVDNDFGSNTLFSLNSFQVKHSLPKTNSVGYDVLIAIINNYNDLSNSNKTKLDVLTGKYNEINKSFKLVSDKLNSLKEFIGKL